MCGVEVDRNGFQGCEASASLLTICGPDYLHFLVCWVSEDERIWQGRLGSWQAGFGIVSGT